MNVWRRHGARLAAVLGLVLLLNACGGGVAARAYASQPAR